MNKEQIERLAEKLGLPIPECDNEEKILIRIATSKKGYSIPECENEERILLEKYGII